MIETRPEVSVIRLGPLAILILGIVTGNAALALDMYLPALPDIATDLAVPEGAVQITLSTFLIGFGTGQIVYGPLSDRFGRRVVLLAGLGLFGLVGAALAMSEGLGQFSILRIAQGLFGASGAVLGRAIVRDVHDGPTLARAMSMLMLVLTAGPLLAPAIGAALLTFWGWRSIFWALAIYAGVWSVLILMVIPETLPPEKRVSIRPAAVLRSFGQVLGHREAMGYALTCAFGFGGLFAYLAETPFLFMELHGISPTGYAIFFAVNVIAMAISSTFNGRMLKRVSAHRMLRGYTCVMVCAAGALLAGAVTGLGGIWGLAVPLFFYIGCLNAVAANGIAGMLRHFGHIGGTASSVFGTISFGIGSVIGLTIAGLRDGSPVPLAILILVCAALAFAALRAMIPKTG